MAFIEHTPLRTSIKNNKSLVTYSFRGGVLMINIGEHIANTLKWKEKDKIKFFYDSDAPHNIKLIKSKDLIGFTLSRRTPSKGFKLNIGKIDCFKLQNKRTSIAKHFFDGNNLFIKIFSD